MLTSRKQAMSSGFHLLSDVGKAFAILASTACVFGGALYAWFEGTSLTVENHSGSDLPQVTLLTGHPETGVEQEWQEGLTRSESRWSYTFSGKDRAVLRYEIGERLFEKECLYESGIAISVRMQINADGSLVCDSYMRI